MQIHKDKQMQHATGNGLQRSASDSDYFILDRASFNQGINAKYKMTISRGGYMPTLVAKGPHAVAVRRNNEETSGLHSQN